MVAVLLTILKILGMILLVVLGIILTVALLILFAPIRYRIQVHRKTEDETPIAAEVRVTYLAHIVNAAFSYPAAAYLRVRVFCFTVFRSDKPKGHTRKSSSENEKGKEKEGMQDKNKEKMTEDSLEEADSSLIESRQEDDRKGDSANREDAEDKFEKEENDKSEKGKNKKHRCNWTKC